MAESSPHFRIGDFLFRGAEGFYEETGLRAARRRRRSLFAERQSVAGSPGVQNVRTEDLRWLATSWAGGEGQRVIDATDAESFRRYDRSRTIDLSNPGELRLARQMVQQGSTGSTPTTVEADTWVDDVGASTVVGTDRRLNAVGDAVKKDIALGAGQFQIDFYAYVEAATVIEGSALVIEKDNAAVNDTDMRLKSEGAVVRTVNQSPGAGNVTVAARLLLAAPEQGAAQAVVKLVIWNQTADEKVAEVHADLRTSGGTEAEANPQVTFKAKAGKTYRYKLVLASISKANFVTVDKVTVDPADTKTFTWEIKDGATVVASGTVDMTGISTTQRIASATITSPGKTYTLRLERTAGASRRFLADKGVYQIAAMNAPRLIELGRGDLLWLVDYSASAASRVLYWDTATDAWVSVGTIGEVGAKASSMAHSDNYEFIALDDKMIYRVKNPSTAEALVTDPMGDKIVGLTVGGSRLLILTESQANGSMLYHLGLEVDPGATPTECYPVGNKGIIANIDTPHRMAATKNGAVFFANQGPDCWIYTWDGSAGVPFAKLPPGFKARGIVHSNGISWVGGGFPTVDSTGATNQRPAILLIDHATGDVVQLDVRLHRDEDPTTLLEGMQLFGSDVWVQTEVQSTPRTMRVWRISLRSPIAAFLEHEVTLDETQVDGEARGLAVTGGDAFVVWSIGFPYQRTASFNVVDPAYLISSRYAFALSERKRLDEFEVAGVIPAGCAVRVAYEIDDSGTFEVAGELSAPGVLKVSTPDNHVMFRSLRYGLMPLSSDPNATPGVYELGIRGYLPKFDKTFELLLLCANEGAVWRIDGQQVRGIEGLRYLETLADSGAHVEFVDYFASEKDEEAETFIVTAQDLDAFFLKRGEALVRITLARS